MSQVKHLQLSHCGKIYSDASVRALRSCLPCHTILASTQLYWSAQTIEMRQEQPSSWPQRLKLYTTTGLHSAQAIEMRKGGHNIALTSLRRKNVFQPCTVAQFVHVFYFFLSRMTPSQVLTTYSQKLVRLWSDIRQVTYLLTLSVI